jgi:hypothetical protein
MHHTNGSNPGDQRPLISLTTRGLLAVAIIRLEAAWDNLTPREQALLLDILNLVAARHRPKEAPVEQAG